MRGTLAELCAHFEAGVRGELVVVVAGRPEGEARGDEVDHAARARELAAQGLGTRDIRDLLIREGLRKNDAYALALQATSNA